MANKSNYVQCFQDERSIELVEGLSQFGLEEGFTLTIKTETDESKGKPTHRAEIDGKPSEM